MTSKKRRADPELLALIESIHRKMEGVTEEEVYAILEAIDAECQRSLAPVELQRRS